MIVGTSLINSGSSPLPALRWTAATGMRDLRQELLNAGATAIQNSDTRGRIQCVRRWLRDRRMGLPGAADPGQPFIAVLPVAGGGGQAAARSSVTLSSTSVRGGRSVEIHFLCSNGLRQI